MNKFFLNLGRQPLANNFLTKFSSKQPTYNLKLFFNTKTKMVSISKRIPSSVMFNSKYPYRSSMSSTMRYSFKKLSDEIIRYILENHNNIVFLLWGNNAKKILKNKDIKNHYILEANHPSPLSANKGGWFGNKHFIKTNDILCNCNKKEINWIPL